MEGIGKCYGGEAWGIRDIDLTLEPGIHGLLGPNGAGKSTLMRILTTVSKPTTGATYWNGTDVIENPAVIRRRLGYLPQDFGSYPDLTAREFLAYIAALRGLNRETADARVEKVLNLTDLQDVGDRRLRTFSGGMYQRVGIAQSLVNDPELLVVDEPTVGLDPEARVRFRNVLSGIGSDRVVILSTHIVPDIEATANTVALLSSGRLLDHTTPEALVAAAEGRVYECTVQRDELEELQDEYQVSSTIQRPDGIEARLIAADPPTADARTVPPTLEDGYLYRIDESRP